MTPLPPFQPGSQAAIDADALLLMLRRKEQTWVDWGHALQALQKAGYSPQQIFEETGFEPIQQNQVTVAAQVYAGLESAATSVREYFSQRHSDVLYEFRILNQAGRVQAATLAAERQFDADQAREIAKAVKEFSRVASPPAAFSDQAGDAVAYQCWRLARQQEDLQARSRLIARGLQFASSASARQALETLLTDFAVVKTRPQPSLPLYRPSSGEELVRLIPVVGQLPLTPADLKAVPLLEEIEPFRLVQFTGGAGAWVPVPGWQVIRNAEDPVGLLARSDQLSVEIPGSPEQVLVLIDRAQRQWQAHHYFIVERSGELALQWFDTPPEQPLLGQLLLVVRPHKMLDETLSRDLWQIEE
ncbi:hypothetical protein GS597_05515 [Synechococcales cyanobacterium C]|uniref:RuBisCO accumulation factor 1 n=1 Tax=Petrachloros mirabilis ULC683 TaxID=2781853 RepID=A0A8K1ZYH8_9CYAN|nr:RuBisCO accumulation factor 1 [Petrachloros mirabilis]NCJ05977.1 hypothetical protein [Petrachloros mirabilis ULC683]